MKTNTNPHSPNPHASNPHASSPHAKNLHKQFVRLAFDINKMKNKLISLLLEIYKHEINKNHGCATIYEYGFKYARLSREVVDKALRTMKHLEDKPCLKKAIESEGIHKVALVATIATKETDGVFAKHVRNMSKPALAEFARELREKQGEGGKKTMDEKMNTESLFGELADGETGFGTVEGDMMKNESGINHQQKCRAAAGGTKIELDAETEALFLQLKKKYTKDSSNKYALKILLQKLAKLETAKTPKTKLFPNTSQIETSKKHVPGDGSSYKQPSLTPPTIQQTVPPSVPPSAPTLAQPHFESRYIRAHQKRNLLQKNNNTCAYPNCSKPHDAIHHRTPFAINRTHKDIIPLCKTHHEFAHNGLIAHEQKSPAEWRLNMEGGTNFVNAVYGKKRAG